MNEGRLRHLIGQVKTGKVSRRAFLRRMAAAGLAAPLANQLLAYSGVAMAQSKPTYKPTKRGGGGLLKVLWWQAPTLLNPHFAVGNKDQDGSRLFYEPLAGWDAEGNLRPTLAESIPGREDGTLAADGKSVTWKLKKGVKWHDGQPFTADDVVFTWQYAQGSGDGGRHQRGVHRHHGREGRRAHRHRPLQGADAVLGRCLRRCAGHDHSQAPVRRLHRRQVARGADQPQAGRHRSLHVQGLQAGRHGDRRDQPELSRREPAALRRHRDEGRRRCGVGGARRAAVGRVRLRLEHAGRGRDPHAPGEGRQGPRRHQGCGLHRAHPAQQHRSVDRGRRRAFEHQDQASDAQRSGGAPGAGAAGRQGFGREAHLRPHRPGVGQLHLQSGTLPLQEHEVRVQRRQGDRHPGEGGLEEGRRRHPREGRQEAQIPLPDLDQPAAPEDAGDRQAGLPRRPASRSS